MKTTQRQAYTRLFKKLSALRATLPNDERAVLDSLIVFDEVSAHKMNTKAVNKASKASEVAAHKMNTKAAGKAVNKASNKASEVAAHKMNTKAAGKAVNKAANKAANKTTFRIAFDPNSEEYKIQD